MAFTLIVRFGVLATLLAFSACGDIDLGDGPGPDVRKERGPLTLPPAGVRAGTAF